MSTMLKLSEAASLALHGVVLLASEPEKLISTKEISDRLNVSEAHLSKVLQRLARSGIVKSMRGPKGGFTLAKPADEIPLIDVYEAIEGKFIPTDCVFDAKICAGETCIMGGLLKEVDQKVRHYLTETRLIDLTDVYRSADNEEDEGHNKD